MIDSDLSPLIVVAGPTGSGKSCLGVNLALRLGGEIVNCDSVQVYRGLNIGSSKLTVEERQGVPHHLIDVVAPEEELTAGEYARLATTALYEIRDRGALPIIVGGTGFYLRALLDGLSPAPKRDQQLRSRLAELSVRRPGAPHRYLRRLDLASAEKIHPNDRQKIIRAVELTLLSGRPASVLQSQPRVGLHGFRTLKLGLEPNRGALHLAINRRSDAMFSGGLLEETKTLLCDGLPPDTKALQSLGYRQAVEVLIAGKPVFQAIEECQAKTRQYAKRQLTWFHADREIYWVYGFGSEPAVQLQILEQTRLFLSASK